MASLPFRSARAAALGLLSLALGCFASGDGTEPPSDRLNFPVGLAVSPDGTVLYAANSNFDLQWSGGTVQAYDLAAVRRDALALVRAPGSFPRDRLVDAKGLDRCGATTPPQGAGFNLGEQCAPPVKSQLYVQRSVTIGAFAADLQRSRDGKRLFVPVRGDASLTWLDVGSPAGGPADPFRLACGQRDDGRCDDDHRAGNKSDEAGNSRRLTLPGEPFGLALSEDDQFAVLTHQTQTKTSLLRTGAGALPGEASSPSLQFVVDGVTNGGVGITAIPHDPEAFRPCLRRDPAIPGSGPVDPAGCAAVAPRPAFLQTSRSSSKVDLLRLYEDEGYERAPSQPRRPFLQREGDFEVVANAGNFDSRGIAIDPTPRLACHAQISPGLTGEALLKQRVACARRPARVFIANRSPSSLLVGEIGEESVDGERYNPDRLKLRGSIPLSFGPSRVYLAPVVERDGTYGLRVFVVCFDASVLYVIEPSSGTVENIVRMGDGPFAMAFDPFDLDEVARGAAVPEDPKNPGVHKYRFAYVAVFRNSQVQVLDLDNSVAVVDGRATYERIVFNLGEPIAPKGGL